MSQYVVVHMVCDWTVAGSLSWLTLIRGCSRLTLGLERRRCYIPAQRVGQKRSFAQQFICFDQFPSFFIFLYEYLPH